MLVVLDIAQIFPFQQKIDTKLKETLARNISIPHSVQKSCCEEKFFVKRATQSTVGT